jgi:hypothetical protein
MDNKNNQQIFRQKKTQNFNANVCIKAFIWILRKIGTRNRDLAQEYNVKKAVLLNIYLTTVFTYLSPGLYINPVHLVADALYSFISTLVQSIWSVL